MEPRPLVFISYARADLEIAQAFKRAIETFSEVFMDVGIPVAKDWAEKIRTALQEADLVVVLLSANSVNRDMVIAEVETAWRRFSQEGKPAIAPVRIAYQTPFEIPLSGYLRRFQETRWDTPEDTAAIAAELARSLGVSARPVPVEIITADFPQSDIAQIFLDRGFENRAREASVSKGVTMVIKGPRQVGKTHLLDCMVRAAAEAGKRIAALDFQYLDSEALDSAPALFSQFAGMLSDALGLKNEFASYRREGLPLSHNCTTYVQKYILAEISARVFLAIDEADRLIEPAYEAGGQKPHSFRADLFRMLRKWHLMRQPGQDVVWNRLDLALVTSTEPYLLIPDKQTSPFNVAQKFEFTPLDLTPQEVATLNSRYGGPVRNVSSLYDLLHGHPALTQDAFFLIRSGQFTEEKLFETAAAEDGPFSSHLRYYMFRLHQTPDLAAAFCRLIRYKTQPGLTEAFRLSGAGLVRQDDELVQPRCRLYATFFTKRLKC